MEAIGPGTPLICVKFSWPFGHPPCDETRLDLDPGAMYFCEAVVEGDDMECPWDGCGRTGYAIQGKRCSCWSYIYCPNLFRPLNDGDTSLVNEKEDLFNSLADVVAEHLANNILEPIE